MNLQEHKQKADCPINQAFQSLLPPSLCFLSFCFRIFIKYDIGLILTANTVQSGFTNLKIRWSLYWPQGRGKTTCYQQLHLAFHFLVFTLIIPLLPVTCAPWRQCEQPIKQASSTSLPLSTTPHYLPSPPGPHPMAHQKQNKI